MFIMFGIVHSASGVHRFLSLTKFGKISVIFHQVFSQLLSLIFWHCHDKILGLLLQCHSWGSVHFSVYFLCCSNCVICITYFFSFSFLVLVFFFFFQFLSLKVSLSVFIEAIFCLNFFYFHSLNTLTATLKYSTAKSNI